MHFRYTASRKVIAAVAIIVGVPSSMIAQGPPASTARPPALPASGVVRAEPNVEQRLQTEFKVPAGFKVTLFAGPPVAMYPTCVNESPDGAVFVCVDPNLSLSTLKNVGRVMRLVDTDGDGRADKYTTFATMDSPRGVVSDGRTVYVMHPPTLTAYRDTNGDGIADESTDIVTGLGFDLDFRGADHTTNNVEIGPDGWLYIAVGDYGFIKAVGTDGRQIQHRGGGVVRVRPDGTNLEIVTVGTRNIYDVAIDPFARVYARDNTNDGDGWDTRLHYLAPGANMGYPMLYQNFRTEHFPTLADYGPGAGVGGLWIQDPAWPAGYNNTLFTGDWTMQKIYRHTLTPKGTYFDIQQDEFIGMLRPSDLALDASSNLYVSSLAGGQFTYNSDTVGYLVQVRPPNLTPVREASVSTAGEPALVSALGSPNALHRLHASEELVRRPATDATIRALRLVIGDGSKSADSRAAAIFVLKQIQGAKANDALVQAAGSPDARIRETALRMLVDRTDQLQGVSSALYVKALSDADGQVQVQGVRGLVRLGARDAAGALVPLTGSTDQGLAHLAVNALVSLGATDAAVKGIDASPAVRVGALRALSQMHDGPTVTALLDRLHRASDAPMRTDLLHALARLHNREGYWKGDWWTTRPAHLGPFFDPAAWEESPRIRAALTSALLASTGSEFSALVNDLVLNAVLPRGSEPILTALTASRDPLRAEVVESMVGRTQLDAHTLALASQLDAKGGAVHGAVAQLLAGESTLGSGAMPMARTAVLDVNIDPKIRGALLTTISQVPGQQALDAAAEVFARLNPVPGMPAAATAAAAASASPTPPAGATTLRGAGANGASSDPIEAAWRRFVGDRRRMGELDYFINMSKTAQPSQRTLAYAVLLQSVRAPRTPPAVRDKVTPVLEAAWTDAASAPSLVQAVTLMRLESQYSEKLAAYNQSKPR